MKLKSKLYRSLRGLILAWRHGRGDEYWVVRARRDGKVVIVATVKSKTDAINTAKAEGRNFLSLTRVLLVNLNR